MNASASASSHQPDAWHDYNTHPVQFEDFFQPDEMDDDPLASWGPMEGETRQTDDDDCVMVLPRSPAEMPQKVPRQDHVGDIQAQQRQPPRPLTISPQALQAPFPPTPTDNKRKRDSPEVIDLSTSPGPALPTPPATASFSFPAPVAAKAEASSSAPSSARNASNAQRESFVYRQGVSRLQPRAYISSRPPPTSFKTPSQSSSSLTKPPMGPTPSNTSVLPPDIEMALEPQSLAQERPIELFRHLRTRVIKGDPLPPIFEPNPAQLEKMMKALRRHAPAGYLRKMADDDRYIRCFRAWLVLALKAPETWANCVPPMLYVLARTDIAVDVLADVGVAKMAKRCLNVFMDRNLPNSQAVVDAYKAFHDWCRDTLFKKNRRAYSSDDDSDDQKPDTKKMKMDPKAGPSKSAPPDVKPSIPRNVDTKPQVDTKPRIDAKPKYGLNGGSKTDMSFFGSANSASTSTNKSKPLPSIPRKTSPPRVPPPTSSSLLAQTLAQLRPNLPAAAAPAVPQVGVPAAPAQPKITKKPNTKGHIVRFRDESLEEVKEFTQAAHEFELAPWQEDMQGVSMHQMDVGEGSALKHHDDVEEEIEWYEPFDYTGVPAMIPATPESLAQEQREQGIINLTPSQMPQSADESDVRSVTHTLTTHRWQPVNPPAQSSVSTLLNTLNPVLFGQQPQAPVPVPQQYGYEPPVHVPAWQAGYHAPEQHYGYEPARGYPQNNGWGGHAGQYQYGAGGGGGGGWEGANGGGGGGYEGGHRGGHGKKRGKRGRGGGGGGEGEGRPQDSGWGSRR